MIAIMLSTCLVSDPAVCREQKIPLSSEISAIQCMKFAAAACRPLERGASALARRALAVPAGEPARHLIGRDHRRPGRRAMRSSCWAKATLAAAVLAVRDGVRDRPGHDAVPRPQVGRFHQGRHDPGPRSRRRSPPSIRRRRSIFPAGASTAWTCQGSICGAASCRPRASTEQILLAPISTGPCSTRRGRLTPTSAVPALRGASLFATQLDGREARRRRSHWRPHRRRSVARKHATGAPRSAPIFRRHAQPVHGADAWRLRSANLDGASFENANLARAVLEFASLRDANLRGARLNGSELAGADLQGADVTGADFDNADVTSTRLIGLRGRNGARNLDRARRISTYVH